MRAYVHVSKFGSHSLAVEVAKLLVPPPSALESSSIRTVINVLLSNSCVLGTVLVTDITQ